MSGLAGFHRLSQSLRILPLLAALCSGINCLGIEGVVWTLDGRRIGGDVRLGSNALVIARSSDGELTVPVGILARAQFSTNVIAARTRGSGNGLLGIYFPRRDFSSNAVMRLDETVDFDWREREPIFGIPRDGFSVRWMGYLEAPTTDTYTIHFLADEGGRIYFDDKLVADTFAQRQVSEAYVSVGLNAGARHKLMLEYFDVAGNARAKLSWSTVTMPKTTIPQDRLYAASFDSNHVADASALAGTQGLLATYYNSSDFSSNSFTRIDPEIDFAWKGASPAPGISNINFSVRWLGNLLVTNSGEYQFYVWAGLPLRLFINENRISNPWMVAVQHLASTTLNRSERNELRLEIQATNNVVPVRLLWSGPGFGKTLLTREHFTPAIAPSREPPAGPGQVFPAGVVLTSGAILSAPIQSANGSSLRLQGVLSKQTIALSRVARIHVKPLTTDLASVLPKARTGVLLKNRDFIDGDFAGIESGRVRIESVLFGNRSFDLGKEVVTVVLRGNEPKPWRYSITARDGTVLYGSASSLAPEGAGIKEAPEFRIVTGELAEIVRLEESAAR